MRKLLLTCCMVALVAAPFAFGQPKGAGGGGMFGQMLLANKSVQEELKLTDAQKEKVGAIQKEQREAIQKAFQDKDREAITKVMEDSNKALDKVKEGLTSTQKKRLAQIEIQTAGLQAFAREDVAKALNLSDKQKEEAKEIGDEVGKDAREIMADVGRDMDKRAEAMKKVAKLRKDAIDKVAKTLSEEQQKAWKDLTGEPFELKMEAGGGFGFPGGGKGKGKGAKKDA